MNPNIIETMLVQIGGGNIMAISGGRFEIDSETQITLPVGSGYRVEVEYVGGFDLYEVRRVLVRGNRRWVKGVVSRVYCDQVGETAYRASCFHDEFGEVSV